MNKTLLSLEGVSCRLGGQWVLDQLSLDCRAGEILTLLGPNGAGKTTTINLALGLLKPVSGHIQVGGHAPGSLAARLMTGVMLQSGRPAQGLIVREWLELAAAAHGDTSGMDEAVALAGIKTLLGRRCDTLSGGELQRARLAAAVTPRPSLLFLDEPTVGMDVESRHRLWQGLDRLREAGCAILMTTHDLDEAEQLADRTALLNDGRIVACDRTTRIREQVPGRCIQCHTRLSEEEIRSWPEVHSVHRAGTGLRVMAARAEPVVARLLSRDPDLSGLTVGGASLEEAFLHLTRHATEVAA